jgi:cell division protein FtsZ
MSEIGKAMMGTGESDGEGRALKAAEQAISNPLLDDASMKGARAMLVIVSGGPDLTLFEVDEAVNRVNVLFGSTMLDEMEGRIRVSVVATGIDAEAFAGTKPENVQVLHPAKQQTIQRAPAPALRRPEVAIERANPVHARQEVVEREMARAEVREHARAETREMTRLAAEEPIMLGGMDAPAISEAPQRPQHQAREMREVREQRELRDYRSAPPPKRGGVFGGLFGRPRTAVHMEPTVPPPRPRATAQVVTRAQSAAPQQPLQREPERQTRGNDRTTDARKQDHRRRRCSPCGRPDAPPLPARAARLGHRVPPAG